MIWLFRATYALRDEMNTTSAPFPAGVDEYPIANLTAVASNIVGPPRVKEEDIRADFADGFKLVELKEIRFDSSNEDQKSALAWRIVLERTAD